MALFINHAGGYSYRICPASEKLTEDCFQAHPLSWADMDTTTILYSNGTEISIPAHKCTIAGKDWAANPIPTHEGGSPFKAPCPGCEGDSNNFNLMDTVKVPDVAPGDYVVSWRWDCEATTQVWANCGDVTIVAGAHTPAM